MTVTELAKEVAHQQGEASTDIDILTMFEQWVVEGVGEVLSAHPWPFYHVSVPVNVINGTQAYDLPANIGAISAVVAADTGLRLRYIPADERALLQLNPTDTGTPLGWSYGAVDEATGLMSIEFWPIPSSDITYTVHASRAEALELDADDAIPLPAPFIPVLRNFVRAQYREHSDDGQTAALAWGRYQATLAQLAKRYVDTPARVAKMQPRDVPGVDAFGIPRLPTSI